MRSINPNIFKAYDIRGIYPSEIDEKTAERIGRAFVLFLSKKTRKKTPALVVALDVRGSSLSLKNAFIKGALAQGGNIHDAGMASTPYFYFVLEKLRAEGGVMITASHNPAEYNGLKLRGPNGEPIYIESGLKDIQKVASRAFAPAKAQGKFFLAKDYSQDYLNFISRKISIRNLKVAIDGVGGCATLYLPRLLNKFSSLAYTPLFFTPHSNFNGRSPNPLLPETQEEIKKELKKGGYRFGVIFDGDGDRAVFLDEKGDAVSADFIFLLLAGEYMKRGRKGVIALPLDTSKSVREYVGKQGWRIAPTRRGYPFVKTEMKKRHSPLSVEKSGHFFFKEFSCNDSALLAFLKLAHVLSRDRRPLSQIVRSLSQYFSAGEINFHMKDTKTVLKKIEKHFKEGKKSKLDGVMVEFPDWWFNARPSNTEPLLRLVLEARTEELYEEKLKELKKILTQ